jgi:hypothetical protein
MIETHRDEARQGLDGSCIQDTIEVDVPESLVHVGAAAHQYA